MNSFATRHFVPLRQRLRAGMIIVLTIALLLCTSFSVLAQEGNPIGNPVDAPAGFNSPEGNPVDGYPVVLNGQTLFRVRQGVPGVVSAAERAKIVQARIEAIANNPAIDLSTIRIDEKESVSVVEAGDIVLFTVQDSDKVADLSRQQTAEKAVRLIQSNVAEYRDARSARRLIQGMILALLSTITLIGFLILLQRLLARLLIKIRAARRADRLDIRLQNFQLLGSDATSYLLNGFLQFLRLVLVLGSLYLYIPFVLSQFPATRVIGESILSDIAHRTNQLVTVFVAYLPSLVMIGIIAFLTYYIIGFAKLVITELGRDDAFPWFYPEWIQPTIRLATFLIIAIACVVAGPYLPGFGSPAFQGVSLFLGALLTLGSSSAVANAISGVILIYTRAFRIGDIIRLGEITGEVEEKSLFVTRVVTFKKEVITIPNASVLSSNVVNFNAVLRESSGYLLLHTTITLGYDVSWRKIHDTLIQAAEATSGIVATPRPFVLQTALNDYNVSYELNAYSNCPHLMPKVYSDLHQNIQDYCNQAGIEILSPAYSSIRDGNHSTIPADYLPDDYMSPTFQVQNRNHQS